jgi:sigma-B regulation protein RsbU (phosphoserine phosphatase)
VLVIGTDGIWEAANPRGERFGKEALREVIRRHAKLPAGEMVQAIHETVADFREGLPPADDVTVVVLRVTDPV